MQRPREENYVRGYHATSKEAANDILENEFKESRGPNHWLGRGIYFFQEAPAFARHWVTKERKEGPIPNPVIIAADIEVVGFLDLLEHGWGEARRKTYDHLQKRRTKLFERAKREQPKYKPGSRPSRHPLDRYVIDVAVRLLRKEGLYIRAVRAVFLEGKPLYENSHLMDRQHVQIAVRDQELITRKSPYI